jgi:hypothetical protein
MNAFEYLNKLPLSDRQRRAIKEEDKCPTPFDLFTATCIEYQAYVGFFAPVPIETIRDLLWHQLMSHGDRAKYLSQRHQREAARQPKRPENKEPTKIVEPLMATIFAFAFLFMMCAFVKLECSRVWHADINGHGRYRSDHRETPKPKENKTVFEQPIKAIDRPGKSIE